MQIIMKISNVNKFSLNSVFIYVYINSFSKGFLCGQLPPLLFMAPTFEYLNKYKNQI